MFQSSGKDGNKSTWLARLRNRSESLSDSGEDDERKLQPRRHSIQRSNYRYDS